MTTSLIFTYAILGVASTLSSFLVKGCIKLLSRILHMLKQKFISFVEGIIFRIGRRIERKQ